MGGGASGLQGEKKQMTDQKGRERTHTRELIKARKACDLPGSLAEGRWDPEMQLQRQKKEDRKIGRGRSGGKKVVSLPETTRWRLVADPLEGIREGKKPSCPGSF